MALKWHANLPRKIRWIWGFGMKTLGYWGNAKPFWLRGSKCNCKKKIIEIPKMKIIVHSKNENVPK